MVHGGKLAVGHPPLSVVHGNYRGIRIAEVSGLEKLQSCSITSVGAKYARISRGSRLPVMYNNGNDRVPTGDVWTANAGNATEFSM